MAPDRDHRYRTGHCDRLRSPCPARAGARTGHAGARLGAVYLRRWVDHPLAGRPSLFTVAPGVEGGVGFDLFERFGLELALQAHYLPLEVDGQTRHTAWIGAWLGVGYGLGGD